MCPLTAFAVGGARVSSAPRECRASVPQWRGERAIGHRHRKIAIASRSRVVMAPGRLRKWGIDSPQRKGDSFMEIGTLRIVPTPESIQELDRLGDEIAELAAHLDAATARLLDLIREFDARGGWGNGFRSCAHWLSWRGGFAPRAAPEHVPVAPPPRTLPPPGHAPAPGGLSYPEPPAPTRAGAPGTQKRPLAGGRRG